MKVVSRRTNNRGAAAVAVLVIGILVILVGAGVFVYLNVLSKPGPGSLSGTVLDVPAPGGGSSPQIPPDAISRIGFTLSVPQSRIREMVSAKVPPVLSSNGPMKKEIAPFLQDEWFSFNFRRGNIALQFHDDVVHFTVPINGQVTAGGVISVGPLQRQIEKTVDIAGNVIGDVKLVVGSDFSVGATPKFHFDCQNAAMDFGPFPPVSLCEPVSRVFDEKVPEIAQSVLKDAMQKLQIKDKAQGAWKQMFVAKQASESPPAWVVLTPTKLRMKPLNFNSDPIQVSFAVDARTFVIVAKDQPKIAVSPLPKLILDPRLDGKVNLNLPVAASVDSLSDRLNKELKGKRVPVGEDGVVVLKAVKVGTKGDKIICAVDIDASTPKLSRNVTGTVYLAGKLHYDPATSVLIIEGLDWDAQTKSALVQNAAWLLHDSVLNAVREKANFDAGPVIASAKDQANTILKEKLSELKGPVSVNVNLNSLKLDQIKVENNQAFAFFSATGQAQGTLQ